MKKILFEDALILSFAKTARLLVRFLPLRFSLWIGRAIGNVVYACTKRRKIAYRNLRAAFSAEKSRPEMKRIARASVQNLAMSAIELLRFPDLDQVYIKKHVAIVGTEKFIPTLEAGKGIIFLTAHFGNWELLNVTGGLIGYPMVSIARRQKHPRSDEYLNSLRVSTGCQVIRKGMPTREILRALKKGKIVGILSDQDGGKNGTFVRFFNRLSSTPSGAAVFSLRTGALIFPVFNFRRPERVNHRVEVEGPLAMPDASMPAEEAERMILQQFADLLESKIRKSPDQWLWGHRRWKSTPDRSVLILSDGKTGHLNQSLAVFETIRSEREAQGIRVENTRAHIIGARFKNEFLKNFLAILCVVSRGHLPFKPWLMKTVLERACYDRLMKTYADTVISCGSSLIGVHLLAKYENQAKSLVVMKPPVSLSCFEAVVAPRHDRLKSKDNVFMTDKALSFVEGRLFEAEAAKLEAELHLSNGNKRIGLLVGGDTRFAQFHEPSFQKIIEGIKRYSEETDSRLLATSSRRTPDWADRTLKTAFKDDKHCALLVIANESNRPGVVRGILGLCDMVVVSGESISMVSEAVSSGKPVVVFMPSDQGRLKPKYRAFLDQLGEEKLIIPVSSGDVYNALKQALLREPGESDALLSKDREILKQAVRRVI